MKNILVFGGGGYVGSVLVQDFLSAGVNVTVVDNFIYGRENSRGCLPWLEHQNLKLCNSSIKDFCETKDCFEGFDATVILAGLVGDPITKKYPEMAHAVNDLSILFLIEKLAAGPKQRVVFVSTCSNYGIVPGGDLADEKTQLNPLSLYAKSKVAAEQYIFSLVGKSNSSFCVLRFATAFGLSPRMRFDLTVNEFTGILSCDKPLEVYEVDTWRPYCHIRDFSHLIYCVLHAEEKDINFEVFNAGSDENNLTKRMLLDLIKPHVSNFNVKMVDVSIDRRDYRVSFKKVREVLEFEPRHTVSDAVENIASAFKMGLFDFNDVTSVDYGNYEILNDEK